MHIQTDGVFKSLIFLPKLLMSAVLHEKCKGFFVQLFFGGEKKKVQYGTSNSVKIGLWFLSNNLSTLENLNLCH